ncbi:MAG: hypothetical protein R3E01_33130 [Pirellulaceae bacterium]|nr:SAM-dependent DNA methyltransferase [Planctomycetales bacterium]
MEQGNTKSGSANNSDRVAILVQANYTLDEHREYRRQLSDGSLEIGVLIEHFDRMVAAKEHFVADLLARFDAKKLKALAANLGNWSANRNNKKENAASVYRSLLRSFHLGDSFGYNPMSESFEAALSRVVHAQSDRDLQNYYDERRCSREAAEKALSNPETLAEFHSFVAKRCEGALTDDQLAQFDALLAERSREARAADLPTTVPQFELRDASTVSLTIKEGFHEKRQAKLWIVQLADRVERDTYQELNRKAKMLGGWYSSFKKSDSGFQFLSEESARKFAALLNSDVDRQDELEARKNRKEQSAADRLTELAKGLRRSAEETLEADSEKLKNTVRRAEMAAGIRGRAYAEKALAATIDSIAASLQAGQSTYLDGLRHRTQVELLQSLLNRSKNERNRQQHRAEENAGNRVTYDHYEAARHRKPEHTDIRFAEYPFPRLYKRSIEEAIATVGSRPGCKNSARAMAKRIHRADEYVAFTDEYDIRDLVEFLARAKATGFDTKWLERSIEDYKRLRAANIHDIHELRSALREFLPHVAHACGDDPVRKAEDALRGLKLPDFFPTPTSIVERMIELAEIEPGNSVLEPSCGKGDILDLIGAEHPDCSITAIELNRTLARVLAAKGYDVTFQDFLTFEGTTFDRIIMNPPFGNAADIDHVRHAYDLLAPNGRLVSVVCEGPFFRSDTKSIAFREWLDTLGAEIESLPDGAFSGIDAFRQTGVKVRLVTIRR